MSIVYTGELISKLRKRKKWQQERLLDEMSCYAPTLYRLERGVQLPRAASLKKVLGALTVPMDEMVCPHLENQPMIVYSLRYRLKQALDNMDLTNATELLDELSKFINIDSNVNYQFLLCQRARLLELQEMPPDKIIPLVLEGIELTFEDFNDNSPGDNVLMFEEPELFYTLAKCYARKNDISLAVRMLYDTCEGLLRLPTGERERNRRLLPMIHTLSELYLHEQSYDKALETCEFGLKLSATYCLGQYTPELLYLKVCILHKMDIKTDCNKLLKMALAGHILLGERKKALEVLLSAKSDFGYELESNGIEDLDITSANKLPYTEGEMIECKTIGKMIRTLRLQANLSLRELSQGICSTANLGKIESDEIQGHIHNLEPILQRLGRDPLLYCNFFLSKSDFEAREMRDAIHLLLSQRKFGEASELLSKLKEYKAYKSKANLQFIRRVEAELFALDHSTSHQETQKMLLEAISLTCPQFDEAKIKSYPLSLDESIIISELAISVMESGDLRRAAHIFEALIDNLNRRYVDEFEKARLYGAVMFNYSTCLGRMNQLAKAVDVIETAERFEQSRGRLNMLDALAANKAYILLMTDSKEQSLKLFILSYYAFSMFDNYGRTAHKQLTHELVSDNFGILLD